MAVTLENIAVDLGRTAPDPTSATGKQWLMWISDAHLLIANRQALYPDVDVTPENIDYVVRQAVVAHIRKPDDATTVTIAVDDASSSRRYESGKGRVDLTDWWGYLGLVDTDNGAFTIRPAGTPIICEPYVW